MGAKADVDPLGCDVLVKDLHGRTVDPMGPRRPCACAPKG